MFRLINVIPYQNQWLAGLSLSLGALVAGTEVGWTSPYIAELTAPDSTHRLKLTSSEASWVASVAYLGQLLGAFTATIEGYTGRKKMLLYMSVPMAVGFALIIVGPTVPWLYASRVLSGLAWGMLSSLGSPFLGEIADPMIRGSMIFMKANAFAIGILLGTIMGGLLPMETFSYICLVLTGFFVVSFVFVPESPYYHIAKGDIGKAEESLKWYKKDADVKREIRELQDFLGSTRVDMAKRFNEFKMLKHQKNLLIIVCITVFLYCAGKNTTSSYAEIILRTSKINLKPSVVVMALSFSAIVACTVATVLIDKFGRRPMLMGSGLGVAVGHILLGSHFHMLSLGTDPKSISWLPMFSLFLVYFSTPYGLSTIGGILLGELFPPILKTPASFVCTVTSAIMSFAISKSFQPYLHLVGEKYVFWTFAVCALCSVVFSYLCVPETTRISLINIQEKLTKSCNETEIKAKDIKTDVRIII